METNLSLLFLFFFFFLHDIEIESEGERGLVHSESNPFPLFRPFIYNDEVRRISLGLFVSCGQKEESNEEDHLPALKSAVGTRSFHALRKARRRGGGEGKDVHSARLAATNPRE